VQACKSAMWTVGEQRYQSSGVGGHRPAIAACMARLNVTEAPLDGGRGCREEVRSRWTARLRELQLAAKEVQASKSAVWTAGEQHYPSGGVAGHRPAMAASMARVNVAEAPLDGGMGRRMATVDA
jgi:hypothetical protein